MPQNADGTRTEPAPSEPWWSGPSPAAVAAPAPAHDPPEVIAVFHGLRVMPVSGLSPRAFQPNSGVVVLPVRMAPAPRSRRTYGASTSPMRCSDTYAPNFAGTPFTRARSLIETGPPWSGPSRSPFIPAASAAPAPAG